MQDSSNWSDPVTVAAFSIAAVIATILYSRPIARGVMAIVRSGGETLGANFRSPLNRDIAEDVDAVICREKLRLTRERRQKIVRDFENSMEQTKLAIRENQRIRTTMLTLKPDERLREQLDLLADARLREEVAKILSKRGK